MLDWAYPFNPCHWRGERLTMVGLVGVVLCCVSKNAKKRTIPTLIFYGAIVFDSHPNANRGSAVKLLRIFEI